VIPEEQDRRLLLEIGRSGDAVTVRASTNLDPYRRLEDLGWAVRGAKKTFALTDRGKQTADKLRKRRGVK
jgi:Mn-dependent DtxR family transcriptional regulator